jgi:hypothetical protein
VADLRDRLGVSEITVRRRRGFGQRFGTHLHRRHLPTAI